MSCIEWAGARNHQGYGRRRYKGRMEYAHRVAYAQAHSIEVEEIAGVVRHKCDNPKCINPDHLEVGTKKDNSRDMVERERQANRVLDWETVRWMRANYKPRHPTYGAAGMARTCGVSRGLVSLVILNKIWSTNE